MKFASADDVRAVVEDMRRSDIPRSTNRSLVNDVFNGSPPFTEEEARDNHIDSNVNFLEGTTIAHRARSTWNNAMLKPGNRFTVSIDRGPSWKRQAYGATITSKINKPLRKSRRYTELTRATGAQVVLHGIGPVWWCKPTHWTPDEISLEDMLIPDGTRTSLDNLTHFATYQSFTPGQLYRLTNGKSREQGWNMAAVNAELARAGAALERSGYSSRDLENPEKLTEFYKANSGITDTSKVPTVDCWSFFYQDEEDEDGRWYKKIIVDAPNSNEDKFLYNPKRAFAGDISEIVHFQFGDGANVAPFQYHSIRSIGFLLYATCHLQNRLRCRWMDAIFEATLQYFRNVGEGDRAMLQKIDLMHMGLVPEGLEMVKQADRWQINENLVLAGLSQNRQLMSENASSFVQDVNDGTAKQLTATEVMARMNSSNALVSSLLSMAYTYQSYQYQEISRRFCLKNSPDKDVVAFREACLREGVPAEYLNPECWNIEPERVMGAGNKSLELTQAKALLEIKGQFDPPAQRIVTRKFVLAVTDDPDLSMQLVPEGKQDIGNAAHDGQLAFGALMNGGNVSVRTGMDHVAYVDAMLDSLLNLMEDIDVMEKKGEQPSGQQIIGIISVIKHASGHIQIIAQDKDNGERLKHYKDVIARVMNLVQGYSQRMDEKRLADAKKEQDNGKNQLLLMQAQTEAKIAQAEFEQAARITLATFIADQKREQAKTTSGIQNDRMKTIADIQALDAKTAASVRATKTKAEAASEAAKTKADAKPKPKTR